MYKPLLDTLDYLIRLHKEYELNTAALVPGSQAREELLGIMRMMNVSYISILLMARRIGVDINDYPASLEHVSVRKMIKKSTIKRTKRY